MSKNEISKYLEILELDHKSTLQEITRQYKRLALKVHPDKNVNTSDTTEDFKKLNEAYEKLKNFFEKPTSQPEAKQKEAEAKMREQESQEILRRMAEDRQRRNQESQDILRRMAQDREKRERESQDILRRMAQDREKRERESQEMLSRMRAKREAEQDAQYARNHPEKKEIIDTRFAKLNQENIHELWFDATKIKNGQACIYLQFVSSTDKSDDQNTTVRNQCGYDVALHSESQFILAKTDLNIGSVTYGRSRQNDISTLKSQGISKNAVEFSCNAHNGSVTITSLGNNCINVYTSSTEGKKELMKQLRAGDQTPYQFTIPEEGAKDFFIQIGPHLWKLKRYANMPSVAPVAPVARKLVQEKPAQEFYVDETNYLSRVEIMDVLQELKEVDFCRW